VEDVVLVEEVEDDSIGVTVEGSAECGWFGLGGGRGSLLGFDVICTTL
jgi:hypothetical protein